MVLSTVDHVSFSAVAWISAKRMNFTKGAFSTAAVAWKYGHPHFCTRWLPHSALADAIEAPREGISP